MIQGKLLLDKDALFASIQKACYYKPIQFRPRQLVDNKVNEINKVYKVRLGKVTIESGNEILPEPEYAEAEIEISAKHAVVSDLSEKVEGYNSSIKINKEALKCQQFSKRPLRFHIWI